MQRTDSGITRGKVGLISGALQSSRQVELVGHIAHTCFVIPVRFADETVSQSHGGIFCPVFSVSSCDSPRGLESQLAKPALTLAALRSRSRNTLSALQTTFGSLIARDRHGIPKYSFLQHPPDACLTSFVASESSHSRSDLICSGATFKPRTRLLARTPCIAYPNLGNMPTCKVVMRIFFRTCFGNPSQCEREMQKGK